MYQLTKYLKFFKCIVVECLITFTTLIMQTNWQINKGRQIMFKIFTIINLLQEIILLNANENEYCQLAIKYRLNLVFMFTDANLWILLFFGLILPIISLIYLYLGFGQLWQIYINCLNYPLLYNCFLCIVRNENQLISIIVICMIFCLNLLHIFSSQQFKLLAIEGEFAYDRFGFIFFCVELTICVISVYNISIKLLSVILIFKQFTQLISRRLSINFNIDFMLKKELFEISIILTILLKLKWIDSFIIFILLYYVVIQIRNNIFTRILFKDQNLVDSLLSCRLLIYYETKKEFLMHNIIFKSIHNVKGNIDEIIQQILSKSILKDNYCMIYCYHQAQFNPFKSLIILLQNHKHLGFQNQITMSAFRKNIQKHFEEFTHSPLNLTIVRQSLKKQVKLQSSLQKIGQLITQFLLFLNNQNKEIGFDQSIFDEFIKTSRLIDQIHLYLEKKINCFNSKQELHRNMNSLTLYFTQYYQLIMFQNYEYANLLEQQISDICNQSNKMDKSLLENGCILLTSSLLDTQGKLIKINKSRVSEFLKSEILPTCINDLLPPFLQNLHSNLIKQLIERGTVRKEVLHSYYCWDGYLHPCKLQIFYKNWKQDILVELLLTKEQMPKELILFDSKGQILGISELFYNYLVRNGDDTMQSLTQYTFVQNGMIQYYIPNIANHVQQIILDSEKQFHSGQFKSQWQFPLNHQTCLKYKFQVNSTKNIPKMTNSRKLGTIIKSFLPDQSLAQEILLLNQGLIQQLDDLIIPNNNFLEIDYYIKQKSIRYFDEVFNYFELTVIPSEKTTLEGYKLVENSKHKPQIQPLINQFESDNTVNQDFVHSKKVIQPVKRIILTETILIIVGITILSLNVKLIQTDISKYQNNINFLIFPQALSFSYAATYLIQWNKLCEINNLYQISPYIEFQRQSKLKYAYTLWKGVDLRYTVGLDIYGNSQQIKYLSVKQFVNNTIQSENMEVFELYQICREKLYKVFVENNLSNSSQQDYSIFQGNGFIRQNILTILEFHDVVIESVIQQVQEEITQSQSQLQIVLICQILIIVCIIISQIYFVVKFNRNIQSIFQIISFMNQQAISERIKALDQWGKNVTWSESLPIESLSNRVKEYDQINLLHQNNQTLKLLNYKYMHKTDYLLPPLKLIIAILILVGAYLVYMDNYDKYKSSINLTLKYIKFKKLFDSSIILGELIKTESLIQGNPQDFINQTETIQAFFKYVDQIQPEFNQIMNELVISNYFNATMKQFLLTAFGSNLCNSFKKFLVFCDETQIKLEYNKNDTYILVVEQGINGFIQTYVRMINTEYNFERENLIYDTNENIISSKLFCSIFSRYPILCIYVFQLLHYGNWICFNLVFKFNGNLLYYCGLHINIYILFCNIPLDTIQGINIPFDEIFTYSVTSNCSLKGKCKNNVKKYIQINIFMNNFKRISKTLHYIMHPNTQQDNISQMLLFFCLINKAQELEMLKNSDSSNLDQNMMLHLYIYISSIYSLIQYASIINVLTVDQHIGLIIGIFIFSIFLLIAIAVQFTFKAYTSKIIVFCNQIILFFILLFLIPFTYATFKFMLQNHICDQSYLCTSSNRIGFSIMAIINLITALLILLIHLYYGKCDKLMGDNVILIMNHRFLEQILVKTLTLATVIFCSLDLHNYIRLACMTIKWCICGYQSLLRINQLNFVILDIMAFSIGTSICFNLRIYEPFLIFSMLLLLILQLKNRINGWYVTINQQDNLVTIQILECANKLDASMQFRIFRTVISNNHVCKKNCKTINSMIECLLKKLANDSKAQEQYILIYCDYIANHAPLKGLLRLLLHNSNNRYFQSASNNLIYQLYNRSQQQQKEAKMKNQVRNSNEHSANLDIVSAYQTFHSANILFPSFIETLNYKIDFWTKLINGYSDIANCIKKTYETTQQITKCKLIVEDRFDLEQCKLKISPSADLLSMRILQIYYTGIYQNSYQAYTLERNFEELLKSERFKQDEILDNIQLVQNRLFIFKTSLVNKRGELIKLNLKQLSQFLNDTEDSVRGIVHISQLMPEFLASIHDNLMDNYMQNGYSKLMIHGEQSYFLNTKGYLEPCIVNLFNFYDNNNDFILNMILTKEASNSDTILFGVDGKILGITEQLHQTLNNDEQNNSQREQSIDLLKKGSLIQYFIPDITNCVNDLRLQIINSSNYQLSNLKGIWTFPQNHSECVRNSAMILNKFSRKTKSNSSNYRSYKSQTYSKYTFSSINSELLEYDEGKIPEELREQIMIDKSPIIMLHPQFKEVMEQYYEQYSKNQKQLSVVFNIQFRKLKYKNGQFIYFILNIKETNKVNLNKSFQLSQIESTQFQDNAISEQPQSEKIDVQFIKSTKQFLPYMQAGDCSLEASKYNSREQSQLILMPSSDRPHIFETNRLQGNQSLSILPKQLEFNTIRQEVDQLELEMEDLQVRKRDFEYPALEEEEQIEEVGKRNSVSQSKEKSNILEKFVKGKQMNAENAIDFASNPSRTSTNSTSKESLLIVQQLYHNTALITPLKKISIILFLITSGILTSSILNIQLIKSNLQEQTNEVNNLRQPADINYFYCSALFQMWAFQLNEKQLLNMSPYIYQKNKDVLASMFEFSRSSMFDLSVLVPIQAEKLGFNEFIITQIIEKQKIFSNITYLEFYQILYEQVELAYRQNLGNDTKDYSALYSDQFIRQNIVQMVGFHQDLILSITKDTISRQGDVKTYFLTVLFFELFSVILCIGLQLKIWLSLDEVVKKIIFLVARLNETQAIEQINKLNLIKQLLEDEYSNRWKLFNFGEIVFDSQDSSKSKMITMASTVKQNNYKVSIALYSRIQITKYFKKMNVVITFIIAIIWTIFLMSGYLLHMQNNDDFQPSLVVALKFLQFRHNFDASVFIGGLIKSELLLPLNEAEYINQTETIEQFMRFRANLQPILNEVMNVILQKAERKGVVSRFDGILSQDLCNQFSENLDMCHPSTIKLQYYQQDNYLNVIRTGVLGMTAMFDKFISQEFDYELDQIAYQSNENNLKIVGSQSYQNLFVQYFTDIQDTLRMFLLLFQYDNQSISDGIAQIVTIYYLGFGVGLYFLICLTSFIWVYKAQKYINSTQQILVLIPLDQILNPNIRSQAKEIHSNLY